MAPLSRNTVYCNHFIKITPSLNNFERGAVFDVLRSMLRNVERILSASFHAGRASRADVRKLRHEYL